VVEALRSGEAERIRSAPAVIASVAHGLSPGLVIDLLALATRARPRAGASPSRATRARWLSRRPGSPGSGTKPRFATTTPA